MPCLPSAILSPRMRHHDLQGNRTALTSCGKTVLEAFWCQILSLALDVAWLLVRARSHDPPYTLKDCPCLSQFSGWYPTVLCLSCLFQAGPVSNGERPEFSLQNYGTDPTARGICNACGRESKTTRDECAGDQDHSTSLSVEIGLRWPSFPGFMTTSGRHLAMLGLA